MMPSRSKQLATHADIHLQEMGTDSSTCKRWALTNPTLSLLCHLDRLHPNGRPRQSGRAAWIEAHPVVYTDNGCPRLIAPLPSPLRWVSSLSTSLLWCCCRPVLLGSVLPSPPSSATFSNGKSTRTLHPRCNGGKKLSRQTGHNTQINESALLATAARPCLW